MKMLNIIYFATNGYISFSDNFLKSIKNFAPESKKRLLFLTNRVNDIPNIDKKENEIDEMRVIQIFDLIYPTLNVNKTYLVQQLISDFNDDDYVFYFDADTIFKEVPKYDWNGLFRDLDNGNVLLAKHPFYALKESTIFWGQYKNTLISNLYTENLTEKNPNSSAYINKKEYIYVNSSFYAGTKQTMSVFNDYINEMTKKDLTRHFGYDSNMTYHIPQFIDENYFNKLSVDVTDGKITDIKLKIRQFTELYGTDNKDISTIFLYQKNIDGNKSNRR